MPRTEQSTLHRRLHSHGRAWRINNRSRIAIASQGIGSDAAACEINRVANNLADVSVRTGQMRHCTKLFATFFVLILFPLSAFGAKNEYVRPKDSVFKPSDDFDLTKYTREKYKSVIPALTFRPGENPSAWQTLARARLRQMLQIPAPPYCPLRTQLGKVVPCTVAIGKTVYKYSRQEILFYSRPNFPVIGYLLLPDKNSVRTGKRGAIICLPGHGSRVEDIVGLHPDGTTRMTLWQEYQHDFAVQCVANGYTVLALELLASGARSHPQCRREFPQGRSCRNYNAYLEVVGDNLMGYRVFDVIRAVDYLETRPEVDKKRIATMGISAGGALSLYAAAIEPRISAAVVSGYLCDMEASLLTYLHCNCHYVANIYKTFRVSDIAGIIAPRLLFIESGSTDSDFPRKGAITAFHDAQKIFAALHAPQNIRLSKFEGGHVFDGKEAFASLKSSWQALSR